MSHFRENIDAMTAYVPGEQPRNDADVVKLNTNENPYPPSPQAMEVLRDFAAGRLRPYPDAMASRFRKAAAKVLDVPPEWILPGNGSDDLIMMIARACAGPGRPVAYPVPTFTFYSTQAHIEAAGPVEVPFDEDYALPVDELVKAGAAVTFVASPNSPSGTAAETERLDLLASRLDGVLVIDEAYVDFADDSAMALVARHDNVIVLRTLSKGYSLAGLRLGFGVARPPLLAGLMKTKAIYNVGAVVCELGAAAMEDQDWKNDNARKVRASREGLSAELAAMGFKVWPSQANFLLVRPPEGDAARLYEALKAGGILVRYYEGAALGDKLRITVGADEQNQALIRALQELT